MTYLKYYKYGLKTNTEIDSLTGMSQGDNVFNTDTMVEEIYTGEVWTNEQCIVMTGNLIERGDIVYISSANTVSKALWDGLGEVLDIVGTVHRTGINNKVAVAHCGKYQVKFAETVTRGNVFDAPQNTAGVAEEGSYLGSTGSCGVILESKSWSSGTILVYCMLQFIERW